MYKNIGFNSKHYQKKWTILYENKVNFIEKSSLCVLYQFLYREQQYMISKVLDYLHSSTATSDSLSFCCHNHLLSRSTAQSIAY